MKLKIALAAASIAASAVFATAAQANPVYIGYQIGGSGPITVAAVGNGTTSYNGIVAGPGGGWSVNANVTGTTTPSTIFDLTEPNLTSSNATVGAPNAGTISIYLSQTGLSSHNFGGIMSAFTNLAGANTVDVTMTSYLQLCTGGTCTSAAVGNTVSSGDVFATTNELDSETLHPNTAVTDNDNLYATYPSFYTDPSALYDETVVYTFTFGPTGGNSNAQVGLSAIPEPLTLSLFGAGLAGMGALRRRKKKAA